MAGAESMKPVLYLQKPRNNNTVDSKYCIELLKRQARKYTQTIIFKLVYCLYFTQCNVYSVY